MAEFSQVKKVASLLAAIGEPTRMRILFRLAHGPHNVGQLAEIIGIPMVNMSHHLGVLRQAGLVDDAKDGRRVVYQFHEDIRVPSDDPNILMKISLGRYYLAIKKTDSINGHASPSKRKASPKLKRQSSMK